VALAPRRHLARLFAVRTDRRRSTSNRAPHGCIEYAHRSGQAAAQHAWQQTVLKVRTSNEEFYRLYHQAIDDMAALRLPIEAPTTWCSSPPPACRGSMRRSGRDSLIVSLQNILVYPEFASGSLDVLGRWQATERDDYRDAEPGKIMHELRYGELAHFKLIPHTPYYGHRRRHAAVPDHAERRWRATGDMSLLHRHLPMPKRR